MGQAIDNRGRSGPKAGRPIRSSVSTPEKPVYPKKNKAHLQRAEAFAKTIN
jgi:hypothetical protein